MYKAIDYLREQVRVLVEHQEKENKRILLTNNQRMRVTAKAKRLSRKMLEQCTYRVVHGRHCHALVSLFYLRVYAVDELLHPGGMNRTSPHSVLGYTGLGTSDRNAEAIRPCL
jgi:hypothetical protein